MLLSFGKIPHKTDAVSLIWYISIYDIIYQRSIKLLSCLLIILAGTKIQTCFMNLNEQQILILEYLYINHERLIPLTEVRTALNLSEDGFSEMYIDLQKQGQQKIRSMILI